VEGYPIPIYSTQERTGLALSMPNLCTRKAKKFSKQVTFTDHLIQNLYSKLLKQAIICQVLISKLLDLTQQTTYKLARVISMRRGTNLQGFFIMANSEERCILTGPNS